ncbi:hypothetical protein ILYODFUR_027017 [Ilyodon furcidens]|uniref:Uncharacterized protein n=1 Tax=Ilyodon furcidens TaxID=33524 RepID=A0ABV0V6F7_9TELE
MLTDIKSTEYTPVNVLPFLLETNKLIGYISVSFYCLCQEDLSSMLDESSEHQDGYRITTLHCMYTARPHPEKRTGSSVCLINVWILGGRTQPRCSEGSSSAFLWGRSS